MEDCGCRFGIFFWEMIEKFNTVWLYLYVLYVNGAKEGVAKNFSQNKTNCAIDSNNGFELFFFIRRILVMWFALTMWVVEWNFYQG